MMFTNLLDVLLGVKLLLLILERILGDAVLQSLELECITCGHDVVEVDGL